MSNTHRVRIGFIDEEKDSYDWHNCTHAQNVGEVLWIVADVGEDDEIHYHLPLRHIKSWSYSKL